jgi:hypothetical protein
LEFLATIDQRQRREKGRRTALMQGRAAAAREVIFQGRPEFSGGVAAGIGLSGNLDSQMGAERFPAVAEIVDEKPLGRHRGLNRRDIGFIDGDGVVAVIGPAAEHLLADQRDAERVRIGALPDRLTGIGPQRPVLFTG